MIILVLILVLMEDALAPLTYLGQVVRPITGLNPCFNGRCTRTDKKKSGRRSKSRS